MGGRRRFGSAGLLKASPTRPHAQGIRYELPVFENLVTGAISEAHPCVPETQKLIAAELRRENQARWRPVCLLHAWWRARLAP